MPKPNTPKPPYPAQFRQQMVELVQAGRKPSEWAKEFHCHVTSILSWVRKSGGSVPPPVPAGIQGQALSVGERRAPRTKNQEPRTKNQELIELRRKLRQVQMERDILANSLARLRGLVCRQKREDVHNVYPLVMANQADFPPASCAKPSKSLLVASTIGRTAPNVLAPRPTSC